MAKLKDLKVIIGLSKQGQKKLSSDLKATENKFSDSFQRVGSSMKKFGAGMTAAVTAPLAALAVKSVQAFNEQAKAVAQVEAGLKSTGAQVGYTSAQLQQLASNLQNQTLFGDEEILKDATAQLLTFTNIAGEQFARTQEVALDLATRLDGDLKGASIMLGKALNDPVANLSALSRAGIQFSDAQKEVIKSMAEGGELGEAQTLILEELEKQYGGSAEAAAKAGTGPFKQLANALGDLQEQFGELILEYIQPIIPKLQAAMKALTNMSDETKRTVLAVAAALGAAGPIAMAIGALLPIIGAITSPLGLIVLAIGAIASAAIYFRNEIAGPLADVANFFISIYNQVMPIRVAIATLTNGVKVNFRIITMAAKAVFASLKNIGSALYALVVDQDFEKAKDIFVKGFQDIGDDIFNEAVSIGEDYAAGMEKGIKGRLELVKPEDISNALDLSRLLDFGGAGAAVDISPVVPSGTDVDDDPDGDADAIKKKTKATQKLVEVEKTRMVQLGNLNQIVTDTATETLAAVQANHQLKTSFESVEESIVPVTNRFKEMGKFVADKLPSFFEGAFSALSQGTKAFGDFMLQTLQRLLIKAAALAATFVVLSALMGGATGVAELTGGKAGFKAFMGAGMGLPMMSNGGLFTGASLAMVGEGPGTSMINPEVVAPLDKLQQMMGGGNVTVTGRLDGRDILISSERAGIDRNRVRGF